MKKEIKLRKYQVEPTDNVFAKLLAGKKVILNGCPGSGKTEMAIYIIKMFLDSGKKVLVLAHSTNVLKDNFQDRWNDYYDNHTNLTICIPQSYKADKYDLLVMDEAHENYLAKVVQNITKDIPAHLLLTGTPSKLILEGQKTRKPFEIEVIAMEDIPREFFAKTKIELLSTCYKWTETDYNKQGELKSSTSITKVDTELALDAIILKLIDRLRNKSISAERFNNPGILTRIQKSIFRSSNLGKTMFVCSRREQANYVNNYLVKKGYNSKVSHSTSDSDSSLFDSFKNGEFDVLVVVNRGRLGFSDNNLMNIIDMSGTKNPDLIYQMFARCVRGNQSQNKLFMKLAPTGNAMLDLTSVATQMALSLMFKSVISVFNGKNVKNMFIPILKSSSEVKNPKIKSNIDKANTEKNNRPIFPQYTTDVLVELKDIFYSMGSELSIYKKGEVGEIISQITGSQFPTNWWTPERIKQDALKYKTVSEWENASGAACGKARNIGIMDECCAHMSSYKKRLPVGFWTKDLCIEESSKYKGTLEWQQKSPGSYNAARRLGVFDECCISYEGSKIFKNRKFRTKEEIIALAKTFENVKDWKNHDNSLSYKDAHSKGILPLCTAHMPKKGELKRKWTFDKVKDVVGNQTKSEFRKSNMPAYRRALANGWLDKLFPTK